MAENIKYGSGIFKDAAGNVIKIQGWTENDINKVKQHGTDIEALKAKVANSDKGQPELALKDYYTTDAHKDEMKVGVFYKVPFNAGNEYLEWDMTTGLPKDPQTVATVTDLTPKYFQVVMKNEAGVVQKLGREDIQTSFVNVAFLTATQTFTGENTFEKDITFTGTDQDVDTLNDNKFATAKWVRALATKKINEAGHLAGSFNATGEPQEDTLVANTIVFYKAVDQLA